MSDEGAPLEAHPLFLPEGEGEAPIAPSCVSVERECDGRRESYGVALPADAITTLADLATRWGGGLYTLKARDARGKLLTGGVRRYLIDPNEYPPRPLVEAPAARRSPPAAPVAVAQAPSSSSSSSSAGPETMQLFALLMQQQRDAHATQMAMMQQWVASERESAKAVNAQLGEAFKAIATMRSEANGTKHDPIETLTTGMQLAAQMQEQHGGGRDTVGESIVAILGGMIASQAGAAPPALPSPPKE